MTAQRRATFEGMYEPEIALKIANETAPAVLVTLLTRSLTTKKEWL